MSTSTPRKTPRLGFATKLGYGVGSVASVASATALAAGVMTVYLNQVIGLPVAMVGVAIMISLIFDAVVDPLIGIWSDATNTRWGRRHPFMYAAVIPTGIFIYLLWHTPASWPKETTFIFVLGLLIAVRFCVGLYDTASAALAPELAPDYNERTTLMSYRWFFVTAGASVMVMLLYAVFLRKDATHPLGVLNREGYAHFGTMSAIVVSLSILVAALATHRLIPYLTASTKPESLKAALREIVGTLTNPALLVMMACGLVGGMGNGITGTMNTYFYLYFWELPPQTTAWLIVASIPAALFGATLTPFLSRWYGKKHAMVGLLLVSVVTGLAPMSCRLLGFFPPNGSPWVFIILLADAFVTATLGLMGIVLLSSMVADVVEDAAVSTGKRSEGLLFSANNLVPKISTAVGGFVATVMIALVHFPTHAQQGSVAPGLMRHLALLYLPVSAGLGTIACLILLFYRIDQATHEKNLAVLAEQGLAHLPEPAGDDAGVAPLASAKLSAAE
jgi:GPH family glycoside/pentoside/hexuronide:cation symporter